MSSDYTPTTEQVRDGYAQNEFGEVDDRYAEEFDRWLQQVRAEAKAEALEQASETVFTMYGSGSATGVYLYELAEQYRKNGDRDDH